MASAQMPPRQKMINMMYLVLTAMLAMNVSKEVLDAFESSSLSAPAFAQQCGIKYPTFAAWLAKRKQGNRRPAKPTEHPAFILAELSAAPDDEVLEVRLPGGAVARAAGRDQVRLLAELLRHLA